ncbi:FtsK/SpoIIIE domain-containing protein [Streptomyces sp.]|uniref:FtsK/SpoIIIE domain-containing protein n=1 Tax=Streptomyces sp. TaxID=1931 RepID=UPI002F924A19
MTVHTPPRLFSVPDADEAPVSMLKDAGAVELEPTVIEATPVDQPAPRGDGWMAERRARMAAAPAVIPGWLKDPTEFSESAQFVVRYYAREWSFYAVRAPVYAGRLWVRAPKGAIRLGGQWFRWVTDAESRPVEAKASASDPATWSSFVVIQKTHRTGPRKRTSAIVGVPAGVLLMLAYFLLPGWQAALVASGIALLLGLAGRDSDKPIVHRYVAIKLQRKLDSGEVENALAAIGVKGKPDFTAPIQVDGPGWLAELDLPGAYEADEVLEKRSKLAAAMRRPLSTVWPENDRDAHPGRLRLWVAREDPNKAKRRLWPLMNEGQADLFTEIPYGFDPRGRLVKLRLMYSNLLIGGVMGSGKTSAVLAIALAAALDPTCEMWLYEMKGSGDLDSLRPICHRYVSGDDDEHCKAALDGLKALEREMKRRKKVVSDLPVSDVPDGRKVYPHLAARRDLGLHPLLAILDEVHSLFEHPKYGAEAAEIATRLVKKARAYGIILVLTTQRPDSNSIPRGVSDNAITRILLAVTGHIPNDLIAGTGAYKRGVRGTMFDPERDAGTGWLVRSALNAQIARAAFIKQAEAQQIGKRALALRIAAGTLSGQAAGEDIEEVDESTIVDHLREVWPDGEETMHSHRLVEALGALRPELYGGWLEGDQAARSTMLATALRPHGIHTLQVHKRGAGGGGKGLRWEDVRPAVGGSDED